MACEVPVISSNSGGLPEVNIHGVTGFLSDPGNVDAMAEHAIALLQSEAMLSEFRANALAQARRFDIENILPHYVAFYEEILRESVYKLE
jgi:glycosyltransferase involved in cell wall biosynthesis